MLKEINNQAVKDLLNLIATEPMKAAKQMDEMADKLKKTAVQIRLGQIKNPYKNPNGMADKVTISVIGPDGQPK